MRDFAAIDFETANNERTSVCSVGVVIVRNGEILEFYSNNWALAESESRRCLLSRHF